MQPTFGTILLVIAAIVLAIFIPLRTRSGEWRWRRVMGLGMMAVIVGLLIWIDMRSQ